MYVRLICYFTSSAFLLHAIVYSYHAYSSETSFRRDHVRIYLYPLEAYWQCQRRFDWRSVLCLIFAFWSRIGNHHCTMLRGIPFNEAFSLRKFCFRTDDWCGRLHGLWILSFTIQGGIDIHVNNHHCFATLSAESMTASYEF